MGFLIVIAMCIAGLFIGGSFGDGGDIALGFFAGLAIGIAFARMNGLSARADFLTALEAEGRAAATVAKYRYAIDRLARFAGAIDPATITAGHLRGWATQLRADHVAVQRPGAGGVAGAERLGGGAAGGDARRDGVVDALTGHRVDQVRGVAGEQDPAVRLLPPPRRQRQVVRLPVVASLDGPGQQPVELVEQQGARR